MIPDEKFRKKEHLLKSKDFRNVYKKGSGARLDAVTLCCLPNDLGYNRIGFSISARNVKRANSRNRIRRLFRESYRRNKRALKNSFDIVAVVRRDISGSCCYIEAEKIFLKLAGKAGILA